MDRKELKLELERFADRFSEGWHEGIKIDASDIVLLSEAAQALDQPQRTWQGLTDEEKHKIWYEMQNIMGWYSFQEIANAIEAKLKERNI